MTIVKFTYGVGHPDIMPMPQERVLVSSEKELVDLFPNRTGYWYGKMKKCLKDHGPILINDQGGWMDLCRVIELSRRTA